MGRHAKPDEVKRLTGAHKAHPARFPDFVPKSVQPIGNCPEHLDELGREFWNHVVLCAPKDVLTGMEREVLTIAADLHSLRRRKGVDELPASKISLMIQCYARLGMSPADRQQLGTNEPPAGANEFDAFH